MTLAELGKGSHHCCSNLQAVVALFGDGQLQVRAGLAPGMMLVELGLNSHRCWSFAH